MARTKEEALERIRVILEQFERDGTDDNGIILSVQRIIEEEGVEYAKDFLADVVFTSLHDLSASEKRLSEMILKKIFF